MTAARPLMISLLASASLAIAAPAAAHGAETGTTSHSWGWLGSAVNFVASCLPGSGSTSGSHSTSSKDGALHGSSWWTAGTSDNDDKSHDSSGSAPKGTGSAGTGSTGSGLTDTGATGRDGTGTSGNGKSGTGDSGGVAVSIRAIGDQPPGGGGTTTIFFLGNDNIH